MKGSKSHWINAAIELIAPFLLRAPGDRFEAEGAAFLAEQLGHCFDQQQPLRLLFPGFPCKSPNTRDKSFGVLPDYGEVMAIQRLDQLGCALAEHYEPGCVVTLVSDGTTFNDIVGVSDECRERYNQALRGLCHTHTIAWVELADCFPHASTPDEFRRELVRQTSLPYRHLNKLIAQGAKDPDLAASHDKLCSYLYNDLRLCKEADQGEDQYMEQICAKAWQMMQRGHALNTALKRQFPDDIRLSVHQYDNAGPKFTVGLVRDSQRLISPWHAVPVCRLDGSQQLYSRNEVDEQQNVVVSYQGHPWLYHQVDDPRALGFDYQLQKQPLFGLVVSDPQGIGFDVLSTAFLAALTETFGFVCLSGYAFEDQQACTRRCEGFGRIYQWQFGAVHVVKPEHKPEGFVHSLEKTPLHWDLSMLPLTNEQAAGNEKFSASKFMLYCKTPPHAGEGQTTIVDGRKVLAKAGPAKVREWARTRVTYFTKMTYFGGNPRTYPLVDEHPFDGQPILRYQEGSDSTLQTFNLEIQGLPVEEQRQVIEEVNRLAYDPDCMIEHEWAQNDLVLIDNWRMLHGRLAMTELSRGRELWRVQVY